MASFEASPQIDPAGFEDGVLSEKAPNGVGTLADVIGHEAAKAFLMN